MKINKLIFILPLLFLGCSSNHCKILENSIKDQTRIINKEYTFKFENVFNFEWDTLYIFHGFWTPEEISKITGVYYDKACYDLINVLIWTKDRNIVKEKYCNPIKLEFENDCGYVSIGYNTLYTVKCDEKGVIHLHKQ